MFGLTFFGDAIVGVVCLGLGVYFHDPLLKFYQGAEAFAKNLEAKAAAIKSAVK